MSEVLLTVKVVADDQLAPLLFADEIKRYPGVKVASVTNIERPKVTECPDCGGNGEVEWIPPLHESLTGEIRVAECDRCEGKGLLPYSEVFPEDS